MKSWKMKLFKCKHAGINGECNNPLVPSSHCKNVAIADCPDKYAWIISEFNRPECRYCLKGSLVSGRTEFNCHVVGQFCSDYCTKAQRAMKLKKFKENHPIRHSFYRFIRFMYQDPTVSRILTLAVLGFVFSYFLLNQVFSDQMSGIQFLLGLPGSVLFMFLPLMLNGLLEALDADELYYLTWQE